MDPQMRLQLESVYEATEDGKIELVYRNMTRR
jgi:acyl transferase domain-containing protein